MNFLNNFHNFSAERSCSHFLSCPLVFSHREKKHILSSCTFSQWLENQNSLQSGMHSVWNTVAHICSTSLYYLVCVRLLQNIQISKFAEMQLLRLLISLPLCVTIPNSLPNSIQTCVLLLLFFSLNLKLIKFFYAFSHIIGQKYSFKNGNTWWW